MLKWFWRWRLRVIDEKLHDAIMCRDQLFHIKHVNDGQYIGQYVKAAEKVLRLKNAAYQLWQKLED